MQKIVIVISLLSISYGSIAQFKKTKAHFIVDANLALRTISPSGIGYSGSATIKTPYPIAFRIGAQQTFFTIPNTSVSARKTEGYPQIGYYDYFKNYKLAVFAFVGVNNIEFTQGTASVLSFGSNYNFLQTNNGLLGATVSMHFLNGKYNKQSWLSLGLSYSFLKTKNR